MSALESLLSNGSGHIRGCPLCGEKNAAAVSVRIVELGENGGVKPGSRSTSKTVSLCAEHAAEVYATLIETLEANRARATSAYQGPSR